MVGGLFLRQFLHVFKTYKLNEPMYYEVNRPFMDETGGTAQFKCKSMPWPCFLLSSFPLPGSKSCVLDPDCEIKRSITISAHIRAEGLTHCALLDILLENDLLYVLFLNYLFCNVSNPILVKT